MIVTRARLWILISTALLLSSCSGGGGGSGSSPNNFTAEAVDVITSDPRIGHPLKVSVQVKADKPANNVSISLLAIDDTDDPNAEARQIPLGTESIENLPAGSSNHELNLTIPSSVEFAGPYHIAIVVDPVDEIVESDEDDNTSTTKVNLGATNTPNILLADVALDRAALIINTDEYLDQVGVDNVYNADAGGTITIGADGLEVDETVDIEAFASLRIIRTDNGTSHDVPLYLWNTAEQRYIKAYGIDPDTSVQGVVEWLPMGTFTPQLSKIIGDEAELDDVTRNSEHMDFYFPGKLGFELEQALRYPPKPCTGTCTLNDPLPTVPPPDLTAAAIDDLKSFLSGLPFSGVRGDESLSLAALDFTVCVKIRPADPMVSDSIAEDNEICPAIDIFLPPLPPGTPTYNVGSYVPQFNTPSDPLSSGDGFATKNNNKHFAFNIDFSAGSSADNRGYIEEVTAGLPVRLFGFGFDFLRITGRAQLVPDYLGKPAAEQSGFSYEIRFLNQVIENLPPTTGSVSISLVEYSKEVGKEQQFFVGPVPMVAGGSIGGSFGIDYSFGYGGDDPSLFGSGASANPVISVGTSIGPFAKLEALIFAGVGIKGFSAGVEGVLTLLEEKIVYFIGTEIEVFDDGFESGDVEFITTQLQKLSNIFTGPIGKLNLFAKYTVPKVATCKWKFIKVKCIKLGTIKATKNIYTTPALFRREDILFEDPFVELDVVILSGQSPAYFIP
ncbi:MAG: hypothetical protein DRQ44_02470 [Gammaproteobacteria bacterium]|nr:MAG: hypothetical protein DRQ44_02470 [Gammaproteobacteria bacterium]